MYESATGINPYKQARELAKSLVSQFFNKMRAAQPPPVPPPYSPSYHVAPEYIHVPNFDQTSQSYYVRRADTLPTTIVRKKSPIIIQSAAGYSKVNVQQSRSARQHWETDKYYEHWHKPLYVVHPPDQPYYVPVEPPLAQELPPNPLLKEEWIDYYENLILSKFGFVEKLQSSNTYINCAQSYTFVLVYRILGSLVSKL